VITCNLNEMDTEPAAVIARQNSIVTAASFKAAMAAGRGLGSCLKGYARSRALRILRAWLLKGPSGSAAVSWRRAGSL
jgi:hypothetical protein